MRAGQEGPEESVEVPNDQKALHLHALRMTALRPFGKGVPESGALVGCDLFGLLRLLGSWLGLGMPVRAVVIHRSPRYRSTATRRTTCLDSTSYLDHVWIL